MRTSRPAPTCKDCGARIVFVRLDTGNALPVDPTPTPNGNVCARRTGPRLAGFVISREKRPQPMWLRYTPHHATCGKAKAKKPVREPDPVLF